MALDNAAKQKAALMQKGGKLKNNSLKKIALSR